MTKEGEERKMTTQEEYKVIEKKTYRIKFSAFIFLCVCFDVQADESGLADSMNAFSIVLYQQLSVENEIDANIIFSPYSIYTALGMAYAGAEGDTRREFAELLRIQPEEASFHSSIQSLNGSLLSQKDGSAMSWLTSLFEDEDPPPYTFSVANSIWVRPDFPIKSSFVRLLDTHYAAEAYSKLSVPLVNTWVEKHTEGKITDLLQPSSITPNTRMIIANAVYFLGYWQEAFDVERTEMQTFYGFGMPVKVPLMTEVMTVAYGEDEHYQAISLDYKESSLAMMFLLPRAVTKSGFNMLETNLTDAFIGDVQQNLYPQEVSIHLPRFEMKLPVFLKDTLRQMGLMRAFTVAAEFCGMYQGCEDTPLYIGNVAHQAYIKVDESGTEAAAATAIILESTSASEIKFFRADRPFIYLIYDKVSGIILFMGRMVSG